MTKLYLVKREESGDHKLKTFQIMTQAQWDTELYAYVHLVHVPYTLVKVMTFDETNLPEIVGVLGKELEKRNPGAAGPLGEF